MMNAIYSIKYNEINAYIFEFYGLWSWSFILSAVIGSFHNVVIAHQMDGKSAWPTCANVVLENIGRNAECNCFTSYFICIYNPPASLAGYDRIFRNGTKQNASLIRAFEVYLFDYCLCAEFVERAPVNPFQYSICLFVMCLQAHITQMYQFHLR